MTFPILKKKLFHFVALLFLMLHLWSCSTIPEGVTAVTPFQKDRYLGRWYEIARFDFRFERDLDNTTAFYSVNQDGSVKVVNRGYNYLTREWKEAVGKAKFVGDETTAMLKVSFFGPFYAGYNVIDLDSSYRYALVCGNTRSYLWILARETTIPVEIRERFLLKASSLGFDTTDLIWPKHHNPLPSE